MEKFALQLAVIQKDLTDSLKVNKPIDMTEQGKKTILKMLLNAISAIIGKVVLLMVINVCVKLEIMTMSQVNIEEPHTQNAILNTTIKILKSLCSSTI